jgi:enoyl-CoA hydratase
VVVTGRGACFSAGIDTKVVPGYDRRQQREMITRVNRVVQRLYGLPKPVVAAINGHALGGGLVTAIACDFRVVTTEPCKLGLTEVTAGIPFPAAPIAVVRAELGPETARALVLTGRVFGPREAEAMHIEDELAAPAALVARACARAAALAEAPAYAAVKRQLRQTAMATIADIVAREDDPLLEHWL